MSQQRLTLLIEQACFPLLSNCYFVAYLAVRKYSRSAHLYEVLFHLCFLCLLTQSSIRCRFSTLLMGKEASTKLKKSCTSDGFLETWAFIFYRADLMISKNQSDGFGYEIRATIYALLLLPWSFTFKF